MVGEGFCTHGVGGERTRAVQEASVIASTPLPPFQHPKQLALNSFPSSSGKPSYLSISSLHTTRLVSIAPLALELFSCRCWRPCTAIDSDPIHDTTGIRETALDGKTRPSSPAAIDHQFIPAISVLGRGLTATGYRDAVHAATLYAVSPLPEIGSPTFKLLSLSITLSQP